MENKKLEAIVKLLEKKRSALELKLCKEEDPDTSIPTNNWFALKGEIIGLSEAISVILEAQIEEVE